MTTIIGARTSNSIDSIVLAADTSLIEESTARNGNRIYVDETRTPKYKIIYDPKGNYALAMAGVKDAYFDKFIEHTLEGKIDLKSNIEKGHLPELGRMHIHRVGHTTLNPENESRLAIATRFDSRPRLFEAHPLGKLEEKDFVILGSGAPYARNAPYLELGRREERTLSETIKDVSYAMLQATKDIYTDESLDMAIIRPEGIRRYGPEIYREIFLARTGIINHIASLEDPSENSIEIKEIIP